MNEGSRPQASNVRPGHREAHAHAAEDQPFHYPLQREFAEPDWTRLPGYRDVTKDQWLSAQWQRAHSVKNLKEFSEALGEFLDDDLLADIEADGPATGDWRDGLVRVMDSSRRLLLAHPQLVPVFLARPGLGPNAARLGEITFGLLRRGGLEGERAVEAFRALLIYSLGFAAFQARRLPEEAGARSARAEAAFASLPADGFPEMRRLARHLASPATDHQFHTGLRWLLDGIAAQSGQTG